MAKNKNDNNNELNSVLKSFKDSIDSLNNNIKKIDFKGFTTVVAAMQAEMLAGAVAIKAFVDSVSLSEKKAEKSFVPQNPVNIEKFDAAIAETVSNINKYAQELGIGQEKVKGLEQELEDLTRSLKILQDVVADIKGNPEGFAHAVNPETGEITKVEGNMFQKLGEKLNIKAAQMSQKLSAFNSERDKLANLEKQKFDAESQAAGLQAERAEALETEKKKEWKQEFKKAKLGKKMSMLFTKAITDGPKIPDKMKNSVSGVKDFFKGPITGAKVASSLSLLGKAVDLNIAIIKGFGSALMSGIKWFTYLSLATAALVAAFNPALTQNFMLTLKDLAAVFGAALQPALTAFTIIVRALADSIIPIVNKLAPSFQMLGYTILAFLTPILQALVSVLDNLAPTINGSIYFFARMLSELGQLIGNIVRALSPLFSFTLMMTSMLAHTVELITSVFNSIFDFFSGWIGWLFGMKKDETKFGVTNESQGMSARKAEYQGISDLSSNLIKAAFAGPQSDRLKNIDNNGKKQIELLEQIAEKKNPQPVVNVNNNRLAGAKA